jgi:hypothetical protein
MGSPESRGEDKAEIKKTKKTPVEKIVSKETQRMIGEAI